MHDHVPGWVYCPGTAKDGSCGMRAAVNCPTCWEVHVRLHHAKRRRRMKRVEPEG